MTSLPNTARYSLWRLEPLALLLILLQFADVWTTRIVIDSGGLEGNPISDVIGFGWLIIVKFTITAILMLADQGKLGVDDPIDRYVKGVPSGNKITLRQLAQMRSGLHDYSGDTNKDLPQKPFRQWTPRELVEVAFRHPLLFPPGSAFDYSNTVLLGMVVEKVSGQSLASFIEQNILKPEGMTHTLFPAGAEIPSPHSQGYFKMPDGKIVDATD